MPQETTLLDAGVAARHPLHSSNAAVTCAVQDSQQDRNSRYSGIVYSGETIMCQSGRARFVQIDVKSCLSCYKRTLPIHNHQRDITTVTVSRHKISRNVVCITAEGNHTAKIKKLCSCYTHWLAAASWPLILGPLGTRRRLTPRGTAGGPVLSQKLRWGPASLPESPLGAEFTPRGCAGGPHVSSVGLDIHVLWVLRGERHELALKEISSNFFVHRLRLRHQWVRKARRHKLDRTTKGPCNPQQEVRRACQRGCAQRPARR